MRFLKFIFALVFIIVACRMAWTLGDGGGRVVFGVLAVAGIAGSRFIDPGEEVHLSCVWTELGVLALASFLLVLGGAPWYHRSPQAEREFFLIAAAVGGAAFLGGSLVVSALRPAKRQSGAPTPPL